MLGLSLGLTHHRYSNTDWRSSGGYVRLTSRARAGSLITLRGRLRTFSITNLIGRIA